MSENMFTPTNADARLLGLDKTDWTMLLAGSLGVGRRRG
jgi:hypothetical protein